MRAGDMKTIHVHYFAWLREECGCAEETVQTPACTPEELYAELRSRHGFSLSPGILKVALNDEFGEWRAALEDFDEVSFIPPVSGG